MISGMYLGELVRLIILDFIESELIFVEEMNMVHYRHALFTKGSFYAKYLNEIQSDNDDYSNTKRIMQEVAGVVNGNNDDYAVIKYICQLITSRAAKLSAAALTVLLHRMNKKNVSIAVDGSLFRYHPYLQLELESVLTNLLDPSIKVRLVLIKEEISFN
jgi:hexokinase